MDHVLLPRGASFSPEERCGPYLGSTDYLGVPFLDYPKLVGIDLLIVGREDGD